MPRAVGGTHSCVQREVRRISGGEGLFFAKHDWLTTLQTWVEQGTAPANLVATDGNNKPGTAATTCTAT
jgi:hypothetical protein